MPRVRRSPLPPPPPPDREVTVRSLPAALRSHAKWVDQQFGNNDGKLTQREVAAYERAYGADAGHAHTIELLKQQFELGSPVAPGTPVGSADSLAIATRLVKTGGSGTAEDAAAVTAELARLPAELLRRVENADLSVVACRGSVTDYLVDLRNVRPRGWPPGATWDTVPGVYKPERGEVVIATVDANGGRAVPAAGQGHGSFSVLLHELGHALDGKQVLGETSRGAEFRAAYAADRGALEANHEDYLLQPGDAGAEETFAEAGARYFGHDLALRGTYPNLESFFATTSRALGIPS